MAGGWKIGVEISKSMKLARGWNFGCFRGWKNRGWKPVLGSRGWKIGVEILGGVEKQGLKFWEGLKNRGWKFGRGWKIGVEILGGVENRGWNFGRAEKLSAGLKFEEGWTTVQFSPNNLEVIEREHIILFLRVAYSACTNGKFVFFCARGGHRRKIYTILQVRNHPKPGLKNRGWGNSRGWK